MFKDDYEGFSPVGFGDSIGSQEIHGVGEGIGMDLKDVRPDI